MEGIAGTQDVNSTEDFNYTVGFTWNISDDITWSVRANDRESDRVIGRSTVITEGAENMVVLPPPAAAWCHQNVTNECRCHSRVTAISLSTPSRRG